MKRLKTFALLGTLSTMTLSCNLIKGRLAQTYDASSSFFQSESRPAHELHEIVWALCEREIKASFPARERRQREDGAFEMWTSHFANSRDLHRPPTCNDLLYVATLITLMHAPDPGSPDGYLIGPGQVEEIYHELLSTTETGAPPPEHEHTHLANFSQGSGQAARQMVVDFFFQVLKNRDLLAKNTDVITYLEDPRRVPDDWFREPYYYTYVQYFGGPGQRNNLTSEQLSRIANPNTPMQMDSDFIGDGTFSTLSAMLPYLENLGTPNLYLLPHYESEGGDGGYDVLDYTPATRFGGQEGFSKLLANTRERNIRIASDAVFNHTSYAHDWFKRFRQGDPDFANHYLDITGWRDLGEVDDGSQGSRRYEVNGKTFNRIMIFPAISRNHSFGYRSASGEERKAYRHFYPFQVDLNFLEPRVVRGVWQIIGRELAEGQLAKRADAAIHWVKPIGTSGDGEKAAQAAIQLFRHFVSLVNRKAAVFPEAVNWVGKAHELFGDPLLMGPRLATLRPALGHVGIYSFQAQSTALREMLALRESSAWWDYWQKAANYPPPPTGDWINLISHHDEMMLGLTRESSKARMAATVRAKKGITYKSDFSAAIRLSSLLAEDSTGQPDPRRIAGAFVALFALPGIPQIYYGDELMALNNQEQYQNAFEFQKSYFLRMKNDPEVDFTMPTDNNIYDPRELLRGNIPATSYSSLHLDQSVTNVSGRDLVPRSIRVMSELRRSPQSQAALRSYLMDPLHTGGDGSVLGLVRKAPQNEAPVAVIINLRGETQDIWLNEAELARHFGTRVQNGRIGVSILARQLALKQGQGTVPHIATQASLARLVEHGRIDPSKSTLQGVSHEGYLRMALDPYEFIVFSSAP